MKTESKKTPHQGTPRDGLLEFFFKKIGRHIPSSETEELGREMIGIYNKSPRIAVIGATGVGKSSTINALFSPNPPLKVGDVFETTLSLQEIVVPLGKDRGEIIVIDCPGLGASIKSDEAHIPTYKNLLSTCDVALWIIQATARDYRYDQENIRDVLPEEIKKRLVVGINQIDLIKPQNWIGEFNVPSRDQEKNIADKIQDVKEKISEVCKIPKNRVIAYSAERGYRLAQLFDGMMKACPLERAWLLHGRKELKPYISPALQESAK